MQASVSRNNSDAPNDSLRHEICLVAVDLSYLAHDLRMAALAPESAAKNLERISRRLLNITKTRHIPEAGR